MSEYAPEQWAIVEITTPKKTKPYYRIFGGWKGGFATGDSWKLNSGVVRVEEFENYYDFYGYSGSVYHCNKHSSEPTGWLAGVLNNLVINSKEAGVEIKILDRETTNVMELDYND